ncbi:MAG TPA: MotA/TolQ/ExbB proton channel family protein [Gemmatimonadales bacterium]|nr:MotA/TolQ/ExbB proton channel family protein [Gemmatimonadales bacterium]
MLPQVGGAVPTTELELIAVSSFATKIVLGVLALFSAVSWFLIFAKLWQFRRIRRASDEFFDATEQTGTLAEAREAVARLRASPFTRLFVEGLGFFGEVRPGGLAKAPAAGGALTPTQLEALRMVLDTQVDAEHDQLGRYIPWLATFGSVSPLIGLLGTVLGVMDAFIGISVGGSGNISAVAPGVAEALVTTVAGLAVAIPSVIAYNIFTARQNFVAAELEGFGRELIVTLAREGRL